MEIQYVVVPPVFWEQVPRHRERPCGRTRYVSAEIPLPQEAEVFEIKAPGVVAALQKRHSLIRITKFSDDNLHYQLLLTGEHRVP